MAQLPSPEVHALPMQTSTTAVHAEDLIFRSKGRITRAQLVVQVEESVFSTRWYHGECDRRSQGRAICLGR